jgi:hypothetical protein
MVKGLDEFKEARFVSSADSRCRSTDPMISLAFRSSFAFAAAVVDPLRVAISFISVILDHHIFANEAAMKAAERGTRSVLSHSSIYFAHCGVLYSLQDAALRFRPNGDDVRCHDQPAKYMCKSQAVDGDDVVIFRCSHPHHDTSGIHGRKFAVKLLKDDTQHWFVGNQPRIMVKII